MDKQLENDAYLISWLTIQNLFRKWLGTRDCFAGIILQGLIYHPSQRRFSKDNNGGLVRIRMIITSPRFMWS